MTFGDGARATPLPVPLGAIAPSCAATPARGEVWGYLNRRSCGTISTLPLAGRVAKLGHVSALAQLGRGAVHRRAVGHDA